MKRPVRGALPGVRGLRPRRGAGQRPALLVAALLAALAAGGLPAPAAAQNPCLPYIAAAERYFALPAGLLLAVALTESGRDGEPFPWAMNLAGEPVFTDGSEEMLARLLRPDGSFREDADVGCMQINLHWHAAPFVTAYGDLRLLLQPRYNVVYGGWLLRRLFEEHGSWTVAVALYHSASPERQLAYVCRVWRNLVLVGGAAAPAVPACTGE